MTMKLFFTFCLFLIISTTAVAKTKVLRVYAAASFTNVLQELSLNYGGEIKVVFNFDATSKLAKQIESGAPADLFFSADIEWMDYAETNNLIEKASRINLVSNELVLILPRESKKSPRSLHDLNDSFYHHLALAGEAVPAGKFARAALKSEGILNETLSKKIVNADNVRVALNWVANNEAPVGIVYGTDAIIEPKVKTAFKIKKDSYPQIIYPVAIVRTSSEQKEAQKFLDYCKSDKAREIFMKAGFLPL